MLTTFRRCIHAAVAVLSGLTVFCAAVSAAELAPIRVCIAEAQTTVAVSAADSFEVVSSDSRQGPFIFNPGDKISMSRTDAAIAVSVESPNPLPETPIKFQTTAPLIFKSDGGILSLSGKPYRGSFEVGFDKARLRVIDEVSIEEYLYGVVPSEMPSSWPKEALAAQAVAARTFAVRNMLRHISEGYNLCATTHCQVYKGVSAETPQATQAVDRTKGIVITYQGSPIEALYHSTSGGMTENSSVVWGTNVSYLKAVESTEVGSPYSQWTTVMTAADVSARFLKAGYKIGNAMNILITEYGASGRIRLAVVKGSSGQIQLTGEALRSVLGLNSSLFWISISRAGSVQERGPVASGDPDLPSEAVASGTPVAGATVNEQGANPRQTQGAIAGSAPAPISSPVPAPMPPAPLSGASKPSDGDPIMDPFLYQGAPTQFAFYGRGWGHGVGMSQYGAKTKADTGYTYESILKHYYQGVELKKWY